MAPIGKVVIVMPYEILKVSLKPVNFFTKNPALDILPSKVIHQSTLIP